MKMEFNMEVIILTANSGETKIVKKRFWPWEDDIEEAWLSDMASKGWHFAQFKGRMKYYFVKGKPKKVRYCLDYQTNFEDKDNYNTIFQSC